ncbi:uncharacterized protein PRCAT00002179001 [Priceomyces carsonii]|uniref:uncharacterized protein n=1 Tax=Priceomyces carsonii TaxID=28549 RepID=UPI002EDB1833|nr:unnamed protein product [Priceomyces carsonii]
MSVPSLPIPERLGINDQEDQYVHAVYNEIASHFSKTRYKPWPIVEKFLNSQEDYSVGLDVGCGNGKYLGVNKNLYIIGSDRSSGLIECGNEISKGSFNLLIADGLNLPHPNATFDFAISIAVIHHFATDLRRIDAIRSILTKLKKGGRLLIYCWALEQETSRRGYKNGDAQDVLVPWVLQRKSKTKKKQEKETHGKNQDDPELNQEPETKYRFYHLYKKGELRDDAMKAGNCQVVEEGYERDNWWVIVKKE